MKNSKIIIASVLAILGTGVYFYFKNKKTPTVVSEAPKAGTSVIAENPIDVINKNAEDAKNKGNAVLATIVWQVNNSTEALRLSRDILAKFNTIPDYKTKGSKQAINADIYNWTKQMFDLGYAPNGKGGAYKIDKVQSNNSPADALSKMILAKTNALPDYRTKGSLNAMCGDISTWTRQMFDLGYVPDLKGGSYKII